MLKSMGELLLMAKQTNRKKIAVVFAHDEHVIEALKKASRYKIIEPLLIGDQAIIENLVEKYELKPPYEIINELDGDLATKLAMDLVNQGKADIVMKGLIDTKVLLKGVVNSDYGIKQDRLLSHVGIVATPTYNKVLFATDGAMNISPDAEQKILIIEAAVKLAKALGYVRPKVGLVSAVEKINPKIQSTVDAENILKHYQGLEKDFDIDGPFAIDNLVSLESVKQKQIKSIVAGDVDILVFPNLDAGNIFYKTAVFLARGKSAGIVLGAKVPIVLTSRADSAQAKLYSIFLSVVSYDGLSNSRN